MREKKIILSPSLLSCDFAQAGVSFEALERAGIRQIHLDVMDGIFVPNISFGQVVIRSLRKCTKLFFDTHLMITEPGRYIDDFVKAGSDRITVHLESCADVGPVLDHIAAARHADRRFRSSRGRRPKRPSPTSTAVRAVLVMTVEPGFGGQGFMHEMLPKITQFRDELARRNLSAVVQVDGGIDCATAPLAVRAGASDLVAGSSVFGKPDPGSGHTRELLADGQRINERIRQRHKSAFARLLRAIQTF